MLLHDTQEKLPSKEVKTTDLESHPQVRREVLQVIVETIQLQVEGLAALRPEAKMAALQGRQEVVAGT